MADPKVEVQISGDAAKLKKAAGEAEKAIKGVEDQAEKTGAKGGGFLGGLGDAAGSTAKDKVGPLGDALEKVGVDLDKVGAGGMVAAAGLGAGFKFVADGVTKMGELTDQVRAFKAASGESWETSSRMVAVADDLGVSAEEAAGGMNKLAKASAAGELEKFGIEAVRAKDGTIDMAATLGVVADRMNATHDQAQKAAMGNALLGRSWMTLNPLIEQGSAGIKDAMAGVKGYQIVTEASAAQQRQMAMAIDDMQDSISGLQMSLAKEFIPEITESAHRISVLVDAINTVTGKVGGLGAAMNAVNGPVGMFNQVSGTMVDLWHAATGAADEHAGAQRSVAATFVDSAAKAAGLGAAEQVAAQRTAAFAAQQKDLADKAKLAADALKEERQRLDEANATLLTVAGTQIAYENATASLAGSVGKVTEAHVAMDEAVAAYGGESKEAKAATDDYNASVRDAKGAADAQAQAAANLAEKTALAAGETFTAEQKSIVYRDALNAVRDASNDPGLSSGLGGLVGLVDAASASAGRGTDQFYALANAAAAAASAAAAAAGISTSAVSADSAERALTPQAARASGGPVQPGVPYLVGEHGPEVVQFGQPGQVTPNGGGGATYVVNISGVVGDQDALMRHIHDGLRRLERSKH